MAARTSLTHSQRTTDAVDEHGASIIWNEIHARLYPLCERILNFRPRTVAGVAILARAISLSADTLWDEQESGQGRDLLNFIAAMCLFAGVRPIRQSNVI
jgi:hypothetical protein